MIDIIQTNNNSYDDMPYESYPYYQSSPEKLATIGALFGVKAPKIETARVLELGCAAGGNLIPHASFFPKSQCVGVDLSKRQIDDGHVAIKNIGLKNIELKHCSITDIDDSFGKFDYIICHGVISWVPDFVKEKIFEVVNKNLTENGIAYISYNTLPGWNMVRTIRDMMLYHSKNFVDSKDKVNQARALLAFVKESIDGMDTPYARVLSDEADLLSKQNDHYIRHEHLEDNNKQFYFSEFMEIASKHNLQYLSDANLSTMYLGNFKESIRNTLQDLNDIVRTEQYLDFINNRRFRTTLLSHKGVNINRNLTNEHIRQFAMSLDITPEVPFDKKVLNNNDAVKFFFKNNKDQTVASSSKFLKALFYVLSDNKGYPLKFETLVNKANKLFDTDCKSQIELELLNNAMNLVIKGFIEISLLERDKSKIKVEKPKLNNLALYEVKDNNKNWITSHNYIPCGLSSFDKFVLKYMDGSNTKDQIIDLLVKDCKDAKITVSKDNKPLNDAKQIKQEINDNVNILIDRIATYGILD